MSKMPGTAHGLPEPDSHHIPFPLMVLWTAIVIVLVASLRWAVLYITDVTDPKGRQAKVLKPGQKPGRWDGRGLDVVWFGYYVMHIPITLCLDTQSVFPPSYIPSALRDFSAWYKVWSRDPVIINAGTGSREWAWLDVFLHCEVVVQVPCFALGAWWLWKNDKRAYPLTLAYAAHTATTLLPVLYYLLTDTATSPPLDSLELATLLASYVPFLLIPLGMLVDATVKVNRLLKRAERVEVLEQAESREVESIQAKKRK